MNISNDINKTEKSKLLGEINGVENVYDLYIIIFRFLKGYENDVLFLYTKDGDTVITENLKKVFTLFCDIEEPELSKKQTQGIIEYIDTHISITFLLSTLIHIDNKFGANDVFNYKDFKEKKDQDDGDVKVKKKCLNSDKTQVIGKVFHKTKSYIEAIFEENLFRKDERKGNCIEGILNNLLVVDKLNTDYKINLYDIRSTYISDKLKELGNNFNYAMVPFTCDKEYLKKEIDGNFFIITGIKEEDKQIEKLQIIMDQLKDNNVNIVIFPEMLFTSKMVNYLYEYLKKNSGSFLCVVTGSVWEDKSNWCEIIAGNGKVLGRQYKLNPFRIKDDYTKPGNTEGIIVPSLEKYINIFDFNGFGRVNTPICIDFINNEYFKMIESMGVNICLSPVYTKSLHDFKIKSQVLGSSTYGSVFLANPCIKMANESILKLGRKDILFCYIPVKKPLDIGTQINGDEYTGKWMYVCYNSILYKIKNFKLLKGKFHSKYKENDFCMSVNLQKCKGNCEKHVCYFGVELSKNSCSISYNRI